MTLVTASNLNQTMCIQRCFGVIVRESIFGQNAAYVRGAVYNPSWRTESTKILCALIGAL